MMSAVLLSLLLVLQRPMEHSRPVATDQLNQIGIARVLAVYKLGPDDVVSIDVTNAEEISTKGTPIDKEGEINLPVIGRVSAVDKTPKELEAILTAKLARQLRRPQVVVRIVAFGSQPVSVVGAVQKPGVIQLEGHRSLLDALSLAGGLKSDAGAYISVVRSSFVPSFPVPSLTRSVDGNFQNIKIPTHDLLNGNRPELNINIEKGDTITVPSADMIYVVGEVERAGAFPISQTGHLSILQAIALAGGVRRPNAAPSRTIVISQDPVSHRRIERVVNLKRVIGNKGDDPELNANDIVYVPSSTGKAIALRAIEAMVQTGSGVAIWTAARP